MLRLESGDRIELFYEDSPEVGWSTEDVGLTGLLTPKDVSAIRHDEENKYCAVFLEELPNGLQIAGLNSNGRR